MEKEQAVSELTANFQNATAAFLFDFTGCTCAELTALRHKLGTGGGKLKVVKNSLAIRAVEQTTAKPIASLFQGQTAVIWAGKDPVHSAKALLDFSKEKENLSIRGGIFEGAALDRKEVESLARMESKEVLLGKLLSLMNAPATRLVQMLNAPATQLTRTLEAWREKLSTSGEKS